MSLINKTIKIKGRKGHFSVLDHDTVNKTVTYDDNGIIRKISEDYVTVITLIVQIVDAIKSILSIFKPK